jgi:hypothetical protein
MIVVSDTSPINYLVLIELQALLAKLLDRILIPEAVHRELHSNAAPDPIKRFLAEARPERRVAGARGVVHGNRLFDCCADAAYHIAPQRAAVERASEVPLAR